MAMRNERDRVEEMISRVQGVLGRVAALQSQIRDVGMELTEVESLADELVQCLAEAQHGLEEIGGTGTGATNPRG